jgi:hypothetical protein
MLSTLPLKGSFNFAHRSKLNGLFSENIGDRTTLCIYSAQKSGTVPRVVTQAENGRSYVRYFGENLRLKTEAAKTYKYAS